MKINIILSSALLLFVTAATISCNNGGNNTNEASKKEAAIKGSSAVITPAPASVITVDNLPASMKEYVSKNYQGYTIKNAASNPLCQGGDAIDVSIEKKGSPMLSLIFKPDGTFVQKEQDVPFATAPQKVKNTIKNNYGAFTAGNQIEVLTLADNSTQYLVDLAQGKTTKEVILTPDGVVVCGQ